MPPFVKPFLHALDRLQPRATLSPDELSERARALLDERFGPSVFPAEATVAHGGTGLMSEHTHYFDGFALLLPLAHGTAVAIRRRQGAAASSVTFEGNSRVWSFERDDPVRMDGRWKSAPGWVRLAQAVVGQAGQDGESVEVAVVSTVPACCTEAYLAALAVATSRAMQSLFSLPLENAALLQSLRRLTESSVGRPFSIAYLIAANAGRQDAFLLVDTSTLEHLPLEAPPASDVRMALIDTGIGRPKPRPFYCNQKQRADEVVTLLRASVLPDLSSLRDLEHRDLQHALEALPRPLRPVLRYLVTENRRVQKMVVAVRNNDWQMFGALLLMSHASQRTDWAGTNAEVDFVVEQVESMSLEGMYGASMAGRSGCVLAVGRPFALPPSLDRISSAFEARFGSIPDITML
jgi:galactokinase